MGWDEEYEDNYIRDEEDGIALIAVGPEGEFLPDPLLEELDYELYEQEKEESDSDDFPESFEEWKLLKEQERWDPEEDVLDDDTLAEYEA